MRPIPARIADKLCPEPNTGCLLWWGATDAKGYGIVWWQGKRRRVHRVLHKLRTGRWPRKDRVVLHSCDTPPCADEHHTRRTGTNRQNERDKHAKGRARGHFIPGGGRAL